MVSVTGWGLGGPQFESPNHLSIFFGGKNKAWSVVLYSDLVNLVTVLSCALFWRTKHKL